jgi:hypothetical protein
MLKGILSGLGMAVVSGVLLVGAVNRTVVKVGEDGGQWLWSGDQGRAEAGNAEQGQPWASQDLLAAGSQSRESGQGAHAVEGAAEAADWMMIEGVVSNIGSESLEVVLVDGGPYLVKGRAWRFALEEGFSAEVGDRLTLVGFLDGEEFEASGIHNLTSGAEVLLRDDTGRPLWSGRGNGGA